MVERKVVKYRRDIIFRELYKHQQALESLQDSCQHPAAGVNPVWVDPEDPIKRVGFKCPDCFKIWSEVVETS